MTLTLTDLKIVNTKVNMLPYKSEPIDNWDEIDEQGGDCDSYAVGKMQRLKAMGMPISQMRLATCWCLPNREGYHCVLLVDLDGQTYVLDNRYPLPMEWDLVPYEWDKLQIAGTMNWEKA